MKTSPFTLSIEIGGQELQVHGTHTPEDPGQISGPPERCWPSEPAETEITKTELVLQITDDLAEGRRATRQILIDISDLISECGGNDLVQELTEKAIEDWEPEFIEPERDES